MDLSLQPRGVAPGCMDCAPLGLNYEMKAVETMTENYQKQIGKTLGIIAD